MSLTPGSSPFQTTSLTFGELQEIRFQLSQWPPPTWHSKETKIKSQFLGKLALTLAQTLQQRIRSFDRGGHVETSPLNSDLLGKELAALADTAKLLRRQLGVRDASGIEYFTIFTEAVQNIVKAQIQGRAERNAPSAMQNDLLTRSLPPNPSLPQTHEQKIEAWRRKNQRDLLHASSEKASTVSAPTSDTMGRPQCVVSGLPIEKPKTSTRYNGVFPRPSHSLPPLLLTTSCPPALAEALIQKLDPVAGRIAAWGLGLVIHREPKISELCRTLGITKSDYFKHRDAVMMHVRELTPNVDLEPFILNQTSRNDVVKAFATLRPAERTQVLARIKAATDKISNERLRDTISKRLGLDGTSPQTLREIAFQKSGNSSSVESTRIRLKQGLILLEKIDPKAAVIAKRFLFPKTKNH